MESFGHLLPRVAWPLISLTVLNVGSQKRILVSGLWKRTSKYLWLDLNNLDRNIWLALKKKKKHIRTFTPHYWGEWSKADLCCFGGLFALVYRLISCSPIQFCCNPWMNACRCCETLGITVSICSHHLCLWSPTGRAETTPVTSLIPRELTYWEQKHIYTCTVLRVAFDNKKKKVCGKLITICNTKSSEMPRKVTRMAPVISLQSRPWSEISPSRSHRHHLPTPNILRIILNLTNQQPQPIEVKGLHDGHGFGPIRGLSLHPAHPAASPHLRRSTHYSPLSPVAIVTAI